jgi:hypothetical protein
MYDSSLNIVLLWGYPMLQFIVALKINVLDSVNKNQKRALTVNFSSKVEGEFLNYNNFLV